MKRGEEQNREEGEMAQIKLGGGRNRGKKVGRREKKKSWRLGRKEKLAQEVGRREIYPPVPPPSMKQNVISNDGSQYMQSTLLAEIKNDVCNAWN